MPDGNAIAAFAAAFAAVTWLLGISYLLGRYAARIDGVEKAAQGMDAKLTTIFNKLDALAVSLPHRCTQEQRLAQLETAVAVLRGPEPRRER